ncbi:acyl carrier protein, partial [Streptomyces europaeiscabiei]|uniref:acyl carrier protein n=1 Tax=Streptomyces europaeiscabiei TaxID=146819 RepID=UPI0029AC9072
MARTPVDPPRTPPATPTERLLARAWSELLDVPELEIGRQDDFFALGGDSITVLELFSRLRHERPALPRPTAVYTHRTLVALAAAIDDTTVPPLPPPPRPEGPPCPRLDTNPPRARPPPTNKKP